MIDILGRRILNKNLYELVGFRQCFFLLLILRIHVSFFHKKLQYSFFDMIGYIILKCVCDFFDMMVQDGVFLQLVLFLRMVRWKKLYFLFFLREICINFFCISCCFSCCSISAGFFVEFSLFFCKYVLGLTGSFSSRQMALGSSFSLIQQLVGCQMAAIYCCRETAGGLC